MWQVASATDLPLLAGGVSGGVCVLAVHHLPALADGATLRRLSWAFLEWGMNPDAFAAEAWGEAVAWRP
jgi:hypothetical protein